jgi:hypothetical protein
MFTFLAELFALGGIAFWLLALAVGTLITVLVEKEEGVWATVVAIASILGLDFVYKLPLLSFVKANPGHVAVLVGSYFGIGIVWSLVIKWLIYLHKRNFAYEDFKAAFLTKNNAKELTGELAAKLMEELESHNRYVSDENEKVITGILVRDHIGMLTRWATYWPFSMIGTALNDVVRKSWTYIIRLLQSTYQRMANYVFRKAAADVAMAEQYKAQKAAAGAGSSTTTTESDNDDPYYRGRRR